MANVEKLHNLEDALNMKGVEEQLSHFSPPFEILVANWKVLLRLPACLTTRGNEREMLLYSVLIIVTERQFHVSYGQASCC